MTNSFSKLKLPELKAMCKSKNIIVVPVVPGRTNKSKADHIVALQEEQNRELQAALDAAQQLSDKQAKAFGKQLEVVEELHKKRKRDQARIEELEELEPRIKELEASLKEAKAKWDYYKGRTKEEYEMVQKWQAGVKRRDGRIKELENISEDQGKMLPKFTINPKTPAKAVVAQEAANKSIQMSAFKDFEVNGLVGSASPKKPRPAKVKRSPVKKRSPPKKHYRSTPENPLMSQDVRDLMAGELKRCGYAD